MFGGRELSMTVIAPTAITLSFLIGCQFSLFQRKGNGGRRNVLLGRRVKYDCDDMHLDGLVCCN